MCLVYDQSPPTLKDMKNVSTNSLIEAMEARRDGVFFRVVRSVSDIENLKIDDTSMLYHRSCYKTYTGRRNVSGDLIIILPLTPNSANTLSA
jgi:hypothetical protein